MAESTEGAGVSPLVHMIHNSLLKMVFRCVHFNLKSWAEFQKAENKILVYFFSSFPIFFSFSAYLILDSYCIVIQAYMHKHYWYFILNKGEALSGKEGDLLPYAVSNSVL